MGELKACRFEAQVRGCEMKPRLWPPVGLQVAGKHELLEHVLDQPDVVQLHHEPVTGGLHHATSLKS